MGSQSNLKETKLKEIETEILKIFEDCKAQGMSKDEIREVFAPLGDPLAVNKLSGSGSGNGQWSMSRLKLAGVKRFVKNVREAWNFQKAMVILLGIGLLLAYLGRNEEQARAIKFHGLAVLRIALIKLLPYWNWTDMYYSRCLVRNPFFEAPNLKLDDCNLCESFDEIARLTNTTQSFVSEQFIGREKPFIVTDAMADWYIMNTDQFWFDNITEIYLRQSNYHVCNVNTNLRISNGDFTKLLRRLYNPRTQEWFLHWENCQKDIAKAVRQYYKRPYFVSNSLDFTGSNWVLMSSEFKGRVYKKIEAADHLMMIYQLRGFNHIRISPKETCRGLCPEVIDELKEGEILLVPNMLWDLEYIPGEAGDNLALLSEVSWPAVE